MRGRKMSKIGLKGFFKEEKIESWRKEWQGMPEFVQEDQSPFKSILIHFETREDMDVFSKLVDQKLTLKTKSIWYPKMEYEKILNKRYVDES